MTTHPPKAAASLGNSDHDVVLYDTSLTPLRHKPPRRKLFLWKRADVDTIREDLQEYADAFAEDDTPITPKNIISEASTPTLRNSGRT